MVIISMQPRQFEREMRRWAYQNVPLIGKTIHKAVTAAVYKGIVERTPVLTSRARGNWFPTTGSPSDEATEGLANVSVTGVPMTPTESNRIKAVTSQLDALSLGQEKTYISNNLDYIDKLERGTSPKSPPKDRKSTRLNSSH